MKTPESKILLYYKFVPVPDPDMTMRWQRELCEKLNLRGRIIVSKDGINGTVGGSLKEIKQYVRAMKAAPLFKDTEYKWSEGGAEDFPRLSVKVRSELVTLNPDIEFNPLDKSTGLRPKAWHEYIEQHPGVTIIDARNDYESQIGRFKGAITPKIEAFRDIKPELDKLPKDQPVLTYCTGDIRCEYLSAYMKQKGFKEVYHLDGGIVKYGQEFGDKGYWEGECYVFDRRRKLAFSDHASKIGSCIACGQTTNEVADCSEPSCGHQFVFCGCETSPFCLNHLSPRAPGP